MEIVWYLFVGILSLTISVVMGIFLKWKKRTDKQIVTDKITLIFLGITTAIPLALLIIYQVHHISVKDLNGDVSNWATLVIEVGIGIIIGATIFVYSNFVQGKSDKDIRDIREISKKLDDTVEKIKTMIDGQRKSTEIENANKKFRKHSVYEKLGSFFNGFLTNLFCKYYDEDIEKWQNNREQFREYLSLLKSRFDDLRSYVYANSDVISPDIFRKLDIVWTPATHIFTDFSNLPELSNELWKKKLENLEKNMKEILDMIRNDTNIDKRSPF